MQIKIEIDVKPEELRRFLGLPDIAGLQDDIIGFLRDKMGAAGDFDPASFVKTNLDALRNSAPWKNIAAKIRIAEETEASKARPRGKGRAPRKTATTPRPRRRNKPVATPTDDPAGSS